MTGRVRLLAAAVLLVLAAAPARADYAVGLAAYHGGDFAAARAEFEKVADSDPRALVALGIMAARGDGTEKDMVRAAGYFGRAAAAGDAMGQYQSGRLHYSGAGVAADKAEAARLFDLAAAQGHVGAIQALSLMLETGDGIDADAKRALALARRNADAGVPRDQVRLAKMYAEGRGADVDLAEAYFWAALAARTGQPDGQALRDDYAAKLGAEQVAAQDQRIRDWAPQTNPKQ